MRKAANNLLWILLGSIDIWWKWLISKIRLALDAVGIAKLPSDVEDIFGGAGMSALGWTLLGIALFGLYLSNRDFWHNAIERLRKPADEEKHLTAPIIGMIIFGSGFFVCLIWFLSSSQNEPKRAVAKIEAEIKEKHTSDPTDNAFDQSFRRPDDGPIEWHFDKPVTIFIYSRRIGEGVWIDAIQIHATNKSDRALKNVKAYVAPDMMDRKFAMRVNPHGTYVAPTDSATLIPPRAAFDLLFAIPSRSDRPQGLPAEQFLADYGAIKFIFEYNDGTTFTHDFPLTYLEDQIIHIEERTKEMRRLPPVAPSKKTETPHPSDSDKRIKKSDVTLLKPPFHYSFEWQPEGNSLQIITHISHVPAGKIKPDTRIPVFFIKNLSKEFLRNLQITWMLNEYESLAAKIVSKHLLKYNAQTTQNASGGALHLERIANGSIQSVLHSYQGSEVIEVEFVDPGGEVELCPDRVYAAAEVHLLKHLAGARMGTIARSSILCRIDAERLEPAIFNVQITAEIHAPMATVDGIVQDYGDDARARLKFKVDRV